MRATLAIFGVILILMGILWVLQGLGLVMWPASSIMLANRTWVMNGALTIVAGIAFLFLARRSPS